MAIFDNPWGIDPGRGGADPFKFDPGSLSAAFFQDNPQAAYQRALNQWGGAGQDTGPRGEFFRNQYNRELQNYYSMTPEMDPNTSFLDYLSGRGNVLQGQYQNQAPTQRGLRIGNYQRPNRWTF